LRWEVKAKHNIGGLPWRIYVSLMILPLGLRYHSRLQDESPFMQAAITVGGVAEGIEKKSFKPLGLSVRHGVLVETFAILMCLT